MNTQATRRHHRHAHNNTPLPTRRLRCRISSAPGALSWTLLILVVLVTLLTVNVTSFQVSAAVSEPRKGKFSSTTASSSSASLSTEIPPSSRGLLFPPEQHKKSSADATPTASCTTTVKKDTNEEDDGADADYQRRKAAWAARYTSVDALRSTFGSNRNLLWGDLDAATARRLYKTLLPKALLELYNTGVGVHPSDLAPLAYQARVAAKLYARERCFVPARVAANLYDGFRQWRRYGSFDMAGMSYQQVWNKYAASITDEEDEDCEIPNSNNNNSSSGGGRHGDPDDGLDERDVTAKICLKILERSCETNQMIDKWVLSSKNSATNTEHENNSNNIPSKALSFRKKRAAMAQRRDLQEVTDQLEHDVRQLLLLSSTTQKTGSGSPTSGESRASRKSRGAGVNGGAEQSAGTSKSASSLSVRRFRLLRILARSKRRIEAMQQLNAPDTAADAEAGMTKGDRKHDEQQHASSMDSSNDPEQQDEDLKLPWKDRPRQTTNRRKQWMERDASTIQRRP
jgi:hypothetical protein